MNLSTRTLGLALLLLLLFLGTTLSLQWWLARETRHLQSVAVEEQTARLVRALAIGGLKPEGWNTARLRELGAVIGGRVQLRGPGEALGPQTTDAAILAFSVDVPDAPGWRAQVEFAAPALLRMQVLHQRTLAAIVLLSLVVATVPLLVGLVSSRRPALAAGLSRSPWAATRAQTMGLEHFAKISNERTAALVQEQGARVRAEENLEVNRSLLDHSLAERIKLGRELHDNICQTLYAVCLTLGSVQKKSALPPEMNLRLDQCMTELRRLNQEVRAYLQELEPAELNRSTFAEAVKGMLTAFMGEEGVTIEQRLDEEAVALIPTDQTADIMNILREAVSNSLRHGHARNISLLAGRSEQEVALAVQDDGAGFVATRGRTGHGLSNMHARASALGGSLRIESAPGKGTRILLSLPVASPL